MYEFCKDRYNSFQANAKKWDKDKTPQENILAIPKMAWGFVPGLPLVDDGEVDYFQHDLKAVPPENRARIIEAHEFILKWLVRATTTTSTTKKKEDATEEHGAEKEGATTNDEENETESIIIPKEWETAIDLRTWPDFPDQPSRAPK
jgi:hypothetical protein